MRKIVLAVVVMVFGWTSGAFALPVNNPITAGLIAAYEFSGNADDVSGNGNNGVVNGATLTTDRFGNAGSAYNFDGINDIISIGPVLTTPNSLSIFAWISRGTSTQLWDDIVAGALGAPIFGIQNGSDRLGFGGQNNNPMMVTYDESAITDALWHAFGATYDGTTVRVYRDGDLVASSAKTGSFDTALPLGIGGAEGHVVPEFFAGSIDDVYIYDRALSSTEVQTLYSVVPEPSTALLLGVGLVGMAARRRV